MIKSNIYETNKYVQSLSSKQRKLFFTAIDLFASKGFAKTSTAEISATAHVSEGLLFKTFKSKDNLLKQIIQPIALNILPPRIEMAMTKTNELSLKQFVEHYYKEKVSFVSDNEKLIEILIREIIYTPEIIKTYQTVLPDKFWESTHECLDKLKAERVIADWDNTYLFRTLNSALINYVLRNYLFKTRLDSNRINYTIQATYKALRPE